jgi:hypothetical protein
MPNPLHDKVFEFCESYRAENPNFTYWLRERNTNGRLDEGIWFQGTENYAFVGLYNGNGGTNRTRSIGFVFTQDKDTIGCYFENVFNEEQDEHLLNFYAQMRSLVGGFEQDREKRYQKKLSDNDGFSAAKEFLDRVKPQIDRLIVENNVKDLIISSEQFSKKLSIIKKYRSKIIYTSNVKFIIANITWNSNGWKGPSDDKSGHQWVKEGNIPHESWNFDFDNPRNTDKHILGFAQFTNAPKVEGDKNLVILYSKNKIVGFYGKCEVFSEHQIIDSDQSYNLKSPRDFAIALDNQIDEVKEKGFLGGKVRVGQTGFNYLENFDTVKKIVNTAIELNPDKEVALNNLLNWIVEESKTRNYWIFQGSPKIYDVVNSLKDGALKSWSVSAHKDKIKVGDKVILWITGDKAGCYALCKVTSEIINREDDVIEQKYYTDSSKLEKTDRVKIEVEHNLWDNPILNEHIENLPNLKGLKVGHQGTNFSATKDEYEALLKIAVNKSNMNYPLNQILFGPPGTGKTYHTITEAIKIVDKEFYVANSNNRVALQERFNELLIRDWIKTEGQISFCTFHQSFSYEDFVEGIKPLKPEKDDTFIKYDIINGIFKNICRLADASNNAQKLAKENLVSLTQDEFNRATFYKISLGDSTKEEDKEIYDFCVSNNYISIGYGGAIDYTGKNETQVNEAVVNEKLDPYNSQAINYFKNYLKVGNYVVVSYGNSYIRALGKVTGEYEYNPDAEIRHRHFREVEWIFKNVEIPVTEFYQKNLSQQTIYKLKSEFIIPSFFVREEKPSEAIREQKNFVLVIDEINRGNVSSIFGELITLIEPNKRTGTSEALEVVLPYSKEKFSIPSNVYIVGTMNTADRSIESLDTALRRRFSFICMEPKPELIATVGKSKGAVDGIDLVQMLTRINERIEKLIDKDHKIGHSYFLDVESKEDLKIAFKDKVIPLLEEYFFGDFGKIGLVLGNSFISKDESTNFEFANFSGYDAQTQQDLKERSVYKIKPKNDWDFKSIYQPKPKE